MIINDKKLKKLLIQLKKFKLLLSFSLIDIYLKYMIEFKQKITASLKV